MLTLKRTVFAAQKSEVTGFWCWKPHSMENTGTRDKTIQECESFRIFHFVYIFSSSYTWSLVRLLTVFKRKLRMINWYQLLSAATSANKIFDMRVRVSGFKFRLWFSYRNPLGFWAFAFQMLNKWNGRSQSWLFRIPIT